MADIQNYQMLIDGAWVDASDGGAFDSINPATGEVWSRVPEATHDDVDRAVCAADRAFKDGPWARMTATERGHSLRRLADILVEKSEELGRIEAIDTGKRRETGGVRVQARRDRASSSAAVRHSGPRLCS